MGKNTKIEKVSINQNEIWLECSECGGKTSHKILADIEYSDASPNHDIEVWGNWYIVQCNGCKEIVACRKTTCSEDVGIDPERGDLDFVPTYEIYPVRITGIKMSDEYFQHLPHNIYRTYTEVYDSLALKNKILPGIGIRVIVEAVCKEKRATGENLEAKIDSLHSMGLITGDGKKILHSLRFMGNNSAHDTKSHTHDELLSALKVIDHLLYSVYILPLIAKKLPNK
jgi:hypothetical protein